MNGEGVSQRCCRFEIERDHASAQARVGVRPRHRVAPREAGMPASSGPRGATNNLAAL